jgi:hypothetical protein
MQLLVMSVITAKLASVVFFPILGTYKSICRELLLYGAVLPSPI